MVKSTSIGKNISVKILMNDQLFVKFVDIILAIKILCYTHNIIETLDGFDCGNEFN